MLTPDQFSKLHSESWREEGKNFLVEIVHWVSPDPERPHRWNVYAYLYLKHPIFNEILEEKLSLGHEIVKYFHWGLSYHSWIKDKIGAISCKKLGSDYDHLYDEYSNCSDINNTPTKADAKRLFDYLLGIEKEALSKMESVKETV